MREIKFRAWDEEMEMMVYQGDDEIYICFDGEKWKLLDYSRTHWETDEYGMNEIEQPWEVENIEIMQYTGNKDINGVEIYNGDIVHDDEVIYLVGFGVFTDDNDFQEPTQGQTGFYIVDIHTDETFPFYSMRYIVIGNVYENPELLED